MDEFDTVMTDTLICPFCGAKQEDDGGKCDIGSAPFECASCGKESNRVCLSVSDKGASAGAPGAVSTLVSNCASAASTVTLQAAVWSPTVAVTV